MKAYMDFNRYRGSDKKNQQRLPEQTKPTKAKDAPAASTNLIKQALFSKKPHHQTLLKKIKARADDSTRSKTPVLMSNQFFENFPVNGTNLCARPGVNICNQFYTEVNDTSLVQGAYYLTSEVHSIGSVQKAVNACGNEAQLKAYFLSNLAASSQAVLGSTTCLASAYSHGRTIHLDYQLSGVSPLMCSLLNDDFNMRMTPCVEDAIYNTFDAGPTYRPNSSSSQSSSVHPIVFLPIGAAVGASLSFFLIRRMQQRNNEAARPQHAQPGQNNPGLAQNQANGVNAQPVNMPAEAANMNQAANVLPAQRNDEVAIEIPEQRPRLSPR